MYKEHYNQKWVCLFGASAMTFGKHIYYSLDKGGVPMNMVIHEKKHAEQYQTYGILGFLMLYLYCYLGGRLKGLSHKEAYLNIPFEDEARRAERGEQ